MENKTKFLDDPNCFSFKKNSKICKVSVRSVYEHIYLKNKRCNNYCVSMFVVFMNSLLIYPTKVKIPLGFKKYIEDKISKKGSKILSRILRLCSKVKNKEYVPFLPPLPVYFLSIVGLRIKNFNNLIRSEYNKGNFYFTKNKHKTCHSFNPSDNNELIFKSKTKSKTTKNNNSWMLKKFSHVLSSTFNINFKDPSVVGLQYIIYSFNFKYFGVDTPHGKVGNLSHFKNYYINKVWGFYDNVFLISGRNTLIEKIRQKILEFDKNVKINRKLRGKRKKPKRRKHLTLVPKKKEKKKMEKKKKKKKKFIIKKHKVHPILSQVEDSQDLLNFIKSKGVDTEEFEKLLKRKRRVFEQSNNKRRKFY